MRREGVSREVPPLESGPEEACDKKSVPQDVTSSWPGAQRAICSKRLCLSRPARTLRVARARLLHAEDRGRPARPSRYGGPPWRPPRGATAVPEVEDGRLSWLQRCPGRGPLTGYVPPEQAGRQAPRRNPEGR
jgi:hypothetical protein